MFWALPVPAKWGVSGKHCGKLQVTTQVCPDGQTSTKFITDLNPMKNAFKTIGLGIVFLWFMLGGVAHFVIADFFIAIVPPWVPFPEVVVYVSGVIEIILAAALLVKTYRPLAGWGLIAVTIAVTPANIHMYLHPEQFPEASQEVYLVRLFIQGLLLALIWWSSRADD
jgi:uncharacterized membrane protein